MKRVTLKKQTNSYHKNIDFEMDMTIDEVRLVLDDYERKIPINKHNLDEEVINQSQYFYDISKAYSILLDLKATLTDKLDDIKARLAIEYKESYDERKEKYTAALLNDLVTIDPEYKEISDELRRIKKWVGMAYNLKETFKTRQDMIVQLVKLYGLNYFSEPEQQTREYSYRR